MKKIYAIVLGLFTCLSAQAQTLDFKNLGVGLNQPIYDIDGTTFLSGYTIEILAGPSGSSLTSFGTTSIDGGYFFGGVVTINSVSAGSIVDVVIRAYNGASFETSSIVGQSALFSAITGGAGNPASSPGLFTDANDPNGPGLQSFSVAAVPEPTTIALGVLGGLGMLARRRRNAA